MARDIPLGNGNLLVTFDSQYLIRDWYFPMVGQENHTAGHVFRMGVYIDGNFSWIDDGHWLIEIGYEPNTLASAVSLHWTSQGLRIEATDVVDVEENIFLRHFRLFNSWDKSRDVRLFFSQDFHVYGVDVGDTAFYDPMTRSIIHYKGQRYFLADGQYGSQVGVHQWATGRKEMPGMEGTWRDAEDGVLEGNPIAQGSVDSTMGFHMTVGANQTGDLYTWICAGTHLEEVRRLNAVVGYETPRRLIDRTRAFWKLWVDTDKTDAPPLPEQTDFLEMFRRAALTVRTNIDNRGGIVAANDSDIMHHSRDTYSYVWPRDGAWVARALDVAGYRDLSAKFFEFCADVVEPGGYFLHKYNPDRSLASSWHPWWLDGRPELPIQEDETGIVLWSLWQHFVRWHDVETMQTLRRLIFEAGQFLMDYRHPEWHLPWPSWDLWEERRGIHTYTVASVYAGLMAAGHFSRAFGEEERALQFYQAAKLMQEASWRFLVDKTSGVFLRRITLAEDDSDSFDRDPIPDASLLLLPQLGFVHPSHPAMVKTARWVRDSLWVPTRIGGLARYAGDIYQQADDSLEIPGNPWFISTLWYADYLLMVAQTERDLEEPERLIRWVQTHAFESGVLAEQLHPHTGQPLSVSPLTWSHSSLMLTIARLVHTQTRLRQGEKTRSSPSTFQSVGY